MKAAEDHLKNIELTRTNRHLVVDDAQTNRSLLRMFLESKSKSIVVDEAVDAKEALALVKGVGKDGYDVVWTDVNMDGMSGIELTKELRQTGFAKYVVVLTGNGTTELQASCKAAGVDLVLLKPMRKKAVHELAVMQLYK